MGKQKNPPVKTKKPILDIIKDAFLKASKTYKVEPCNVSTTQFWSTVEDKVTEWEVRKLGGVTGLRDNFFPQVDADEVQPRQKAFKPKVKKLENFTVHDVNIPELFKAAKLGKDDILRIVVQPDTHVPTFDTYAMSVFCSFLKSYKPHGLINLGDFMEMGSVSHWGTNGDKFSNELTVGKKLLKEIGEAAGNQCIFKRFIIGNHEDWLNQYLKERAPELGNLEEHGANLSIEGLLGLKDFGYRVIPLNEILRVGDAHFIHGYYTGVSHAKKHLDVFGVNTYYGHLHDVQSYSGVSVKGVHEAMSLGCLRTLQAEFLKGKPSNWSHSFGIFEFRYDGSYTRYVPIIVNGQFSFNGKLFKAV